MRRRGRVRHHALAVAQIVGDVDHFQRVHEAESGRLAAAHHQADQRAAARHLAQRQRLLRVVRPVRVADHLHLRPLCQEVGDGHRAALHRVDAQLQRLHPLQDHPGVKGGHGRAGVAHEGLQHVVDPFLVAQDGAAQHAALPIHVLGTAVHHNIGPLRQRLLQQRRREDVVDDHQRAGAVGQFGHRRQVHQVQHRVRRRFQKHHGRGAGQRAGPAVQIAAIDEFMGDAVTAEQIGHDPVTGAEQRAAGHHMVAGLQVAEHRRMHCGHAGRGQPAGFGAFQQAQPLLQHRQGGVGEAAVLEPVDLVFERGFRLGRVVIDEAGGQIGNFRRLGIFRTAQAAADEKGGWAKLAGHERHHEYSVSGPRMVRERNGGSPASACLARFFHLAASWPDKSRGALRPR